jgi:hypothetical protein
MGYLFAPFPFSTSVYCKHSVFKRLLEIQLKCLSISTLFRFKIYLSKFPAYRDHYSALRYSGNFTNSDMLYVGLRRVLFCFFAY